MVLFRVIAHQNPNYVISYLSWLYGDVKAYKHISLWKKVLYHQWTLYLFIVYALHSLCAAPGVRGPERITTTVPISTTKKFPVAIFHFSVNAILTFAHSVSHIFGGVDFLPIFPNSLFMNIFMSFSKSNSQYPIVDWLIGARWHIWVTRPDFYCYGQNIYEPMMFYSRWSKKKWIKIPNVTRRYIKNIEIPSEISIIFSSIEGLVH